MARFTASIDDGLKERLDAFAEENGFNRSQALERMIRAFFEAEEGSRTGASSSLSPPEVSAGAAAVPAAAVNSEELMLLKARLAQLEADAGLATVVDLQKALLETRTRLAAMKSFLYQQHKYMEGLHGVVVDNAESCAEGFSEFELESKLEFYVPDLEPPEPDFSG